MPIPRIFNRPFQLCFSLVLALTSLIAFTGNATGVEVGLAEKDITPPNGFPMAGYYHERLAEGQIDPLKAKAIVFSNNGVKAAIVVCDLCGVTTDLAHEIRQAASKKTGIPYENIVVSATHSHTAPDYYRSLYDYLDGNRSNPMRSAYVEKLINESAGAIVAAHESLQESTISAGSAQQKTPVSFNRRFVMRDGSVQTWQSLKNPNVVKSAGPIDTEIGLVSIKDAQGKIRGTFSNFALHLDTVGGTKWSGDYPFFVESNVRQAFGPDVISLFGTGCCGDINHSNPDGSPRNKTDLIGNSLGASAVAGLKTLEPIKTTKLDVRSTVVKLPLIDCDEKTVNDAIATVQAIESGQKVDFLKQVAAHRNLMVDQLRNQPPLADKKAPKPFLRTRRWAGIGDSLPVEVTTICVGDDLAIVCLPGEVFVNLGLAIKQNSPYRNTLIVELSNSVETIYIPTRAAHAGGSYEVTNSTVKPGSGEMLVEAALKLLGQSREKSN